MRSEHRSQPWSPVVGALAGMLVLAAGCGNADQGVVARRSNSSGTSAPVTVAAPPTTLTPLTLPATVVPVTPVATEPPPTTATEVVIPDGSIDLGHGVFVTPTGDWHLDDNGDEVVTLTDGVTTLDLQVLIRDRVLRADGLKVSVFRQVRDGEAWIDAPVDPATATRLEDKILTRAREIRIASADSQG